MDNHNFKFLKQLNFSKDPEENFYFYKLLFNLGALQKPEDENGKKLDYAQKVVNFFIEKIKKDKFYVPNSKYMFEKMEINGFNREFTDFFMKDFDELMLEEYYHTGFISRCYNEFDAVQKTNTNNHGSQRQLKPTVAKFKQYFDSVGFENVTDDTKKIAETLSPYFTRQQTFENAVKIDRERRENNVPDNILNISLKEEEIFGSIDDYAKKISSIRLETLEQLNQIANKEFTFEWLAKNDPQNFILGKFCSCCSHLEGAGYGIMHAGIVSPNVQNLVIRKNGTGEIIAKSTLYINREQGYGVCNNVEVNTSVPASQLNSVYQKYVLGIVSFAEEYNREHPDKPVVQINVGMHLNDLSDEIVKNHSRSRQLFKAINYGEYGLDLMNYNGDSSECQYVIWKLEEKQNER